MGWIENIKGFEIGVEDGVDSVQGGEEQDCQGEFLVIHVLFFSFYPSLRPLAVLGILNGLALLVGWTKECNGKEKERVVVQQ